MSRIRLMVFTVALLFVFPVAAFALSPGDRVTYVTGTTARSGTLLVQTSTLDLVARAGTVSTQDQVVPSVVHPVATPTPTPSPTPTPTPSPSPSPTPSPTPTPTPTPTGSSNCMPDPSSCGYPDIETTGIQAGHTLTQTSGVVKLTTDGMVYEDRQVNGQILVQARNVTIRNVKVVMPAGASPGQIAIAVQPGGDWNQAPSAALTVEHAEIDFNGALEEKGIAFGGYTVRSTLFHNGSDCAFFGDNSTITDSLCASGPDTNDDGWPDASFGCPNGPHYDGFQSDGVDTTATVEHNVIRNPCGQTSAIILCNVGQTCRNIHITNNLMAGGGWTLYCTDGGGANGETVTGNRFARTYYPQGGYWGPAARCEQADVWSGNVWDDTSVPLG